MPFFLHLVSCRAPSAPIFSTVQRSSHSGGASLPGGGAMARFRGDFGGAMEALWGRFYMPTFSNPRHNPRMHAPLPASAQNQPAQTIFFAPPASSAASNPSLATFATFCNLSATAPTPPPPAAPHPSAQHPSQAACNGPRITDNGPHSNEATTPTLKPLPHSPIAISRLTPHSFLTKRTHRFPSLLLAPV
jgi:hypothetical protein